MPIYSRSVSQGNFLNRASIDSNRIIKHPPPGLIVLPKDMYKLFNEFELTQSHLWSIQQYQLLVKDIKGFNHELRQWKQKNGPQIRNLRMTYYFYQNLYSRIKLVNQLCADQETASKSISEIIQWVSDEKPKVRGSAPKKPEPLLKSSQYDLIEQLQLKDMAQYNIRKRQMTPYQKMARTAHTSFFPPKERLLDYQKKEFIMDSKLTIDSNDLREARLSRTSSIKRSSINQKKLRQTATTFQNTKTNFRQNSVTAFNSTMNNLSIKQSISNEIEEVQEPQGEQLYRNLEIREFTLRDPNMMDGREEQAVQREQLLSHMIEEPKYEEDEKDDVEQEELEEQPQKSKYKKAYQFDHNHQSTASSILKAQQAVKDHQQSTLRRLLKIKEIEIQNKLQDLNIKENMVNWTKKNSFIIQQMNRKSESYRCANNFHRAEFVKKGFFQKRKQIPEYKLNTERAKTTQKLEVKNVQQSCEKRKINNALRSFGKYINSHVKINPTSPQQIQDENVRLMRATSLTAFNRKKQKNCLGDILAANQAEYYNEEAQNDVIHLKARLSKKLFSVNDKKLYSALNAVKTENLEEVEAFPKVSNLLSNPFFPKHLYEKKKKKKK